MGPRSSFFFSPLARLNTSCQLTNTRQSRFARRSLSSASRLHASYGFIGLGQMGYPMAQNLRTKIAPTDTLIVHDVNAASTARIQQETDNISIAHDVSEIIEQADTIITVLPEPKHVQAVFQQMLSKSTPTTSTEPNKLFIDCSTIDPKTSADVARTVRESGKGEFVDAPMSGGVVGARAGKLTFMIGSPENLVSRVSEVLETMGQRVIHLGPQTSGLKGKLANNYLLALNNVATAEAMNMGVRWGLDPHKLADMINTATGRCWPSSVNNPVPGVCEDAPAGRDYQGGFGTALMLKDLRLALQAGAEHEIEPLLGAHAERIYARVQKDETCKDRDFSVVYRHLQNQGRKA